MSRPNLTQRGPVGRLVAQSFPRACELVHTCNLPAAILFAGGPSHDRTTREPTTLAAHDRRGRDLRIADDHWRRNLDCSLVTNLNSRSLTQRETLARLISRAVPQQVCGRDTVLNRLAVGSYQQDA